MGRRKGAKQKARPPLTGARGEGKAITIAAPPAALNLPNADPERTNQGGFSEEDEELHALAIHRYIMRRAPIRAIIAGMQAEYGIGRDRVMSVLARVRKNFEVETPVQAQLKEETRQNVRERIYELMARRYYPEKDKHGNPHKLAGQINLAVFRELRHWEEFLSEIEGTKAPLEVRQHVAITAAMTQFVAELTPEARDAMLERARENARLAELAKNSLPAHLVEGIPGSPPVIEAKVG